MLKLIMEELENKGILKSNIIYLNFDSSKFQNIKTNEELNNYITKF